MYYMLRNSPAERLGIVRDPQLPDGVSFMSGAMISVPLPQPLAFAANTTATSPPADYVRYKIPVLSTRLLKELQNQGVDNLQTFTAQLVNKDTGEIWNDYHAVNVVGLIACLAVTESNATPGLPPLYDFVLADLTLVEARTGGALLFRLTESPSVILIDEGLGDHIRTASPAFRGLEFRTVESV